MTKVMMLHCIKSVEVRDLDRELYKVIDVTGKDCTEYNSKPIGTLLFDRTTAYQNLRPKAIAEGNIDLVMLIDSMTDDQMLMV